MDDALRGRNRRAARGAQVRPETFAHARMLVPPGVEHRALRPRRGDAQRGAMTSEHCFAKIADSLDVQALVKAINSHARLWDVITERQNYRGSAHHDTQAIIVRGPRPETRDAFNELLTVDYPYAKP